MLTVGQQQPSMPMSFLDSLLQPTQTPTPKLTKLLVNVTIQGTFRSIRITMSTEKTVADLVVAALSKYVQDCSLPILPTADPSCFDLHYSQFDFESLGREKKLIDLGSRNFYLHRRKATEDNVGHVNVMASSLTCWWR